MTTLSPELERETVKEPAPPKRWRNWWMAHCDQWLECVVCGNVDHLRAGDVVGAHCKTYATLDEATKAARILDALSDETIEREWLGAYPVGERP